MVDQEKGLSLNLMPIYVYRFKISKIYFISSIGRDEFQSLASLIVDNFPGEIPQTFYSPHKGKVRARGKLLDAYYNYKYSLNKAGIISSRSRSSTPRHSCSTSTTVTSELSNAIFDLGVVEFFSSFLKSFNSFVLKF